MENFEEKSGRYASLIDGSYPQPKDGLRDTVMARIADERAARRRRQKALVRWGSIAACLVIVAGAALAVMPKLMSKSENGLVAFDNTATEECANDCESYYAPLEKAENDADANYSAFGNYAFAPNLASDLFEEGHGAVSNGSKALYDAADECDSDEMANSMENAIPEGEREFPIIDEADFDIDGDGEAEHCRITIGPTSGLYSIWFTVLSPNGDVELYDMFIMNWGSLEFETVDGKTMLKHCEHYHGIEILDGHVSLPTDCEDCMINGPKEWQE